MAKYRNEGGTVSVVELGRDVEKGEEFTGSDALAAVHGFVRLTNEKPQKPAKDEE